MTELATWFPGNPFPYDAVLDALHRAGKHFAPYGLVTALQRVRAAKPACPQLQTFLEVALDRGDARRYLALELLGIDGSERRRDRLVHGLLEDAGLPAPELDAPLTLREQQTIRRSLLPITKHPAERLLIRALQLNAVHPGAGDALLATIDPEALDRLRPLLPDDVVATFG